MASNRITSGKYKWTDAHDDLIGNGFLLLKSSGNDIGAICRCVMKIDGVPKSHQVAVDIDAGRMWCFREDANGKTYIDDEIGEIATVLHEGSIEWDCAVCAAHIQKAQQCRPAP